MVLETATDTSATPKFPVETWEAIFRNLGKPGDLYNLCLVSRYFCSIATPILYNQLLLDQNPYLPFTLAKLRRDSSLVSRVTSLTLLPTIPRAAPLSIYVEAEKLYDGLDFPHATSTHSVSSLAFHQVTEDPMTQRAEAETLMPISVYSFPNIFTNLTTFNICCGLLPAHFLSYVFDLPQLVTLHVRESAFAATFEAALPSRPLPLRELLIKGCRTKLDRTSVNVPAILAEGLLKNSPHLSSLTVDLFSELAFCTLLSSLKNPPPISTLNCQGLSHHDADCALMCSALTALPTITSLYMARTPRELSIFLPSTCLPNLRRLTGPIKSLVVYTILRRPLQYITITDAASPSGGIPWENHLIMFLESLASLGTDLKGLAFNIAEWSEEVFLCVCHLWPRLKELTIQCTAGRGVDEYFRVSFGPRFLPRLQDLEVLRIFRKTLKHGFMECRVSKGMPTYTQSPSASDSLDDDERNELEETPFHLQRWEKLNPNLKEVAFNREIWWRRLTPGGWVLKRDALALLVEE